MKHSVKNAVSANARSSIFSTESHNAHSDSKRPRAAKRGYFFAWGVEPGSLLGGTMFLSRM